MDISIIEYKYMFKSSGLFEEPQELFNFMNQWARCRYFEQVSGRAIDRKQLEPNSKKLDLLIQGIQKRGFKPAKIINSISTKFPLSKIVNWKYVDSADKNLIITRLKENGWKDPISLVLIFNPRSSETFHGEFNPNTKKIKVVANADVSSIEEFNEEILQIGEALKHELTHLAQSALKDYKNLHNDPGSPFKKEITPKDKEYLNDDLEFYPILKDWISFFNRQHFVSKEQQEEYFKTSIGIKGSDSIDFFQALKEKEPDKWRKAVKELYKNIVWLK